MKDVLLRCENYELFWWKNNSLKVLVLVKGVKIEKKKRKWKVRETIRIQIYKHLLNGEIKFILWNLKFSIKFFY
jgi:hypothetical protein